MLEVFDIQMRSDSRMNGSTIIKYTNSENQNGSQTALFHSHSKASKQLIATFILGPF